MILVADAKFQEDGSCDIRARVVAKDATGSATNPGEGYAIKRADLSAISLSIYDITDESSPVLVAGPTAINIADVISDTLVTTSALWKADSYGYNFAHVLGPSSFPTGGNTYQAEYKFTSTGGAVSWLKVRGKANKSFTS